MISVRSNILALYAHDQLKINTKKKTKSVEKLSSGYRINRSADDAAGLSISEKMRKQIRGLTRASENIEDGISLCQVADGALNETLEVLQRMRELAIQAANGTNSMSDRQFIDMEIAQLETEIDRIAQTTKFNEDVYPLNAQGNILYEYITDGVSEVPSTLSEYENDGFLREITITFKTDKPCTYDGTVFNTGDTITITGMTTNGKEIRFDGGFYADVAGQARISPLGGASESYGIKKSDLKLDKDGHIYFDSKATGSRWYYCWKNDSTKDPIASIQEANILDSVKNQGFNYFTVADLGTPKPSSPSVTPTSPTVTLAGIKYDFNFGESISIQAGVSAQRADKIQVRSVNATCKGLGIEA